MSEEYFNIQNPEEVQEESVEQSGSAKEQSGAGTEQSIEQSEPGVEKEEGLTDVDNPKSYRYFQSKYDKEVAERERERGRYEEELQRYKSEFEKTKPSAISQVIEPEIPQEPQIPMDYDPADIMIKGTSSYNYEQSYKKYLKDMISHNNKMYSELQGKFNEERQVRQYAEEYSQKKAYIIQEFISTGATEQEAIQAFNDLTAKESGNPRELFEFWKWKKTRKPIIRGERKEEPIPPGIGASAEESPKDDFGVDLLGYSKTML